MEKTKNGVVSTQKHEAGNFATGEISLRNFVNIAKISLCSEISIYSENSLCSEIEIHSENFAILTKISLF